MSEAKDVVEKPQADIQAAQKPERVLQPPVDICEDGAGINLWIDMPGVSRENLNIQVDRETLLIEGQAKIDMAEGMKSLYADIRSTHYRRSFALSSELDTETIEASMKDGVLNLRIHKKPESRPRKIEVVTG